MVSRDTTVHAAVVAVAIAAIVALNWAFPDGEGPLLVFVTLVFMFLAMIIFFVFIILLDSIVFFNNLHFNNFKRDVRKSFTNLFPSNSRCVLLLLDIENGHF